MLAVIRREFEDPVDQVMFILGFKHDPRFRTALEAMKAGANPGIVNAIYQVEIYGAINANLCGLGAMTKKIHEDFGSDVPLSVREDPYEIMVEEMGEKDYGGKWFPMTEVPAEHWVSREPILKYFAGGGGGYAVRSSVCQRHISSCCRNCSSDVTHGRPGLLVLVPGALGVFGVSERRIDPMIEWNQRDAFVGVFDILGFKNLIRRAGLGISTGSAKGAA